MCRGMRCMRPAELIDLTGKLSIPSLCLIVLPIQVVVFSLPLNVTTPPRDMYDKDLAKSFRAFRQKGADHMCGEFAPPGMGSPRGSTQKLDPT